MPDVISLLDVPLPWEGHGAKTALPAGFQALLGRWPGAARDFYCTIGTADAAIRRAGIAADPVLPVETLAPQTLTALQARIDQAIHEGLPLRLKIQGPVAWDGTLRIAGASHLALDFAAARIAPVPTDQPLIALADCQAVRVLGLRMAEPVAGGIVAEGCHQLVLSGLALTGAAGPALRLARGCRQVLIDHSALARAPGPALQIEGDVAQVVLARSILEGSADAPAVRILADRHEAEATGWPIDLCLIETRLLRAQGPAVEAQGVIGLWIERCDVEAAAAVRVQGPALGVMIADNRILGTGGAAPMVACEDTALACLFRNSLDRLAEPGLPTAIAFSGRFGGLLIAGNLVISAAATGPAALHLDGAVAPAFASTLLMLNVIRAPYPCGIRIEGELPRLFLFDNHIFDVTETSLSSPLPQPMVTTLNNLSPIRSLNIPLSEKAPVLARMVWRISLRDSLRRIWRRRR